MGQQQLLLLVLSVIIVGIAVVVGINMFGTSADSANRDAVYNDLMTLGSLAQQYYIKPVNMGGGGSSFTGLTMDKLMPNKTTGGAYANENGSYTLSNTATGWTITGDPKRTNVPNITVSVTESDIQPTT